MIDPEQEFLGRLEQMRAELWDGMAEFAAGQRALRGAIDEAAQDPNKTMSAPKETT